ncbi:MAG: DUF4189 domain-containing protein [Magnetococcus sp. YQC-3]
MQSGEQGEERMKKLAVLSIVANMLLSGSAFAVGAIAIDKNFYDGDPAYGIATGEDSKGDAKRLALRYCRDNGGSECEFVVWFETCGAVAVSRGEYGYGYGRHRGKAVRDALDMCGSHRCSILVAECE